MSKKTVSAAQLAANRANGKNSTGPRTAEGKVKVSGNARKHGPLSEQYDEFPGDNPSQFHGPGMPEEHFQYQATLAAFTVDFAPSGAHETHLVRRLASIELRSRLARDYQRTVQQLRQAQDLRVQTNSLPADPAPSAYSENGQTKPICSQAADLIEVGSHPIPAQFSHGPGTQDSALELGAPPLAPQLSELVLMERTANALCAVYKNDRCGTLISHEGSQFRSSFVK